MKARSHTPSHHNQRGLSLVELVVALALSTLVLAALGNIFQSTRTQIQTQESTARIQENARQALQYLADDVRMAGFMGPVYQYWMVEESAHPLSSLPPVTGECFTTPFRWSVPFIPDGDPDRIPPRLYGQNGAYSWFNGCITTPANFLNTSASPASDVISMHYAGAPWTTAAGAIQTSAIPDAAVGDNDEMFYLRGNTLAALVFTCGKGSGAGAVGAGGGSTCLTRSVHNNNFASSPVKAKLQTSLTPGTEDAETTNYGIQAVLYYVRPCTNAGYDNICGSGDDTVPALVRARMEYNTARCPSAYSPGGGAGGGGGGASSGGAGGASSGGGSSIRPCVVHEVVAEGVVNMQLEYGIDTTPSDTNHNVNRYVTANMISSSLTPYSNYVPWSDVRTVRVWLLIRSTLTEPGYTANNTNGSGADSDKFDVAGTLVTPQAGYRYQLFTSTLNMRNRWRAFP